MTFYKSLLASVAACVLMVGSAQAASYTGQVAWYFTQDYTGGPVYTFVNIAGGSICYYVGENTAYASIFAASQIAGDPVTVSCTSNIITQVAN